MVLPWQDFFSLFQMPFISSVFQRQQIFKANIITSRPEHVNSHVFFPKYIQVSLTWVPLKTNFIYITQASLAQFTRETEGGGTSVSAQLGRGTHGFCTGVLPGCSDVILGPYPSPAHTACVSDPALIQARSKASGKRLLGRAGELPGHHPCLPHRYSGCISLYKTMFEHSSEKQHRHGPSFHLPSLAGAYVLLQDIT